VLEMTRLVAPGGSGCSSFAVFTTMAWTAPQPSPALPECASSTHFAGLWLAATGLQLGAHFAPYSPCPDGCKGLSDYQRSAVQEFFAK
jgi:hypothetical protein